MAGRLKSHHAILSATALGTQYFRFFYDAGIAKAVAFELLLANGETLAHRIMGSFHEGKGRDQLVNVATDGETYGHHFSNGDMSLAYALRLIETQGKAHLTTYGEYLEKHPPTMAAYQIHQGSAWSCSHGVDRWRKDCGCNSGGHSGWNQRWREPLRSSLDWLRDKLAACYEARAKDYLKDPWQARNDYISVLLDRSIEKRRRFFEEHSTRKAQRIGTGRSTPLAGNGAALPAHVYQLWVVL